MTNSLDQTTSAKPVIHGNVDEQQASASTLSMVFYTDRLVFMAENSSGNTLSYGEVPISSHNITQASIGELQGIPLFHYRYKKVWAAFSNRLYSLIPSGLHRREYNDDYLSFAFGNNIEKGPVRQDNLFVQDLVMVYNLSENLEKFLVSKYPGISIRHEKSVLALKGLELSKEIGDLVLVNLCHNHFDIFIAKEGRMFFLNSFPMQNTEEILYYIFDVLKQLDLKLDNFKLRICGLNPPFMDTSLMFKYLPSLNGKIIPENLPGNIHEPATYFTAYHLTR